ncbi:MAG: class I SAM-dependent methyltransferase [Selenomonadales bacterium]|nr:class I SAM-dependent methyltransferase [Selenomonadales bacterium]
MIMSGGLQEGKIVVGNVYDKYSSRNPAVRYAVRQFTKDLTDLVERVAPRSIHEIGCGEGYWALRWKRQGLSVRGSDMSPKIIELARDNAVAHGLNPDMFRVRSIYDWHPVEDGADLIVCCEVLEHLERPKDALRALSRAIAGHVIFSVPHEPVFRFLNMARGKYMSAWGNTPGHIQHWSRAGFVRLVEGFFEVVEIRSPIPWTMLLCRPYSRSAAQDVMCQSDPLITGGVQ